MAQEGGLTATLGRWMRDSSGYRRVGASIRERPETRKGKGLEREREREKEREKRQREREREEKNGERKRRRAKRGRRAKERENNLSLPKAPETTNGHTKHL